MLCTSYGMEFASFESVEELNYFAANVSHSGLFKTYTFISGITKTLKSSTEWFWVESGKKIDYFIQFDSGEPSGGQHELCLGFIKRPNGIFFHDVDCSNGLQGQVLCQSRESA